MGQPKPTCRVASNAFGGWDGLFVGQVIWLELDGQQWAFLPNRMVDGDDRCLEYIGMKNGRVFDLDGRNPFAARLDDVLRPVGKFNVSVGVYGRDISSAEPTVVIDHVAAFILEIAGLER